MIKHSAGFDRAPVHVHTREIGNILTKITQARNLTTGDSTLPWQKILSPAKFCSCHRRAARLSCSVHNTEEHLLIEENNRMERNICSLCIILIYKEWNED